MSAPMLVLLTGGNAGIGFHTVHHLLKTGKYKVLLGARTEEKAKGAIEKLLSEDKSLSAELVEPLRIDITKDHTIDAAVKHVESNYGSLDILVNNAGIAYTDDKHSLREKMQGIFDTNVTGTAVVTEAFAPLLRRSKAAAPGRRVVNVSSPLGSFAWSTGVGKAHMQDIYMPYSVSKSALNMVCVYQMKVFAEDKIAVVIASPGYCETALNNFSGARPASEGGKFIFDAIVEGNYEDSNGKFVDSGEHVDW